MRVLTLNVCGIRASEKKGLFAWLKKQKSDYVCLQEVRAQENQIDDEKYSLNGYDRYMSVAEKKGYSGVAIYSNKKVIRIKNKIGFDIFDKEGRFIEAEYDDCYISSVYFPSGSSGDERQKQKYFFMDVFEKYLIKIKSRDKPSIICGDWNIVHKEIDIKNWKSNQKNSGCLPEERAWLDKVFDGHGYIDAFRVVNKKADNYTWWSNRGRAWDNKVGWRIDYQVLTPGSHIKIKNAQIYKKERFSDHSPLIINYEL